jgi:hypothetical protein
MWCIPPNANAEFVRKIEHVLEVYKRPYNPLRPVVCMDETSNQLIAETRKPLDAERGQPCRVDCEYERKGVADLFMFLEPLRGWRRVSITRHNAARWSGLGASSNCWSSTIPTWSVWCWSVTI